MWFTDRATMQPLDKVASLMGGIADEAEAGASVLDLTELCHRLEECGRFLRLDRSLEPTMYRGTMLSRSSGCRPPIRRYRLTLTSEGWIQRPTPAR
jgi:hypothetical protein